ncbi:hypothetical protein ACFO1B_27010 [Dactylosporangium siamense]|uniref:Uncharacterized protein n=1 Tax=Dactylosporangium siamense TaxID=685454 RepID=A0A919PL28_9ACTN|nr:hypothetical protein [Dactylosporangium siamense]GIG46666.1 hypothetical protein Dsi01nite_047070 [Dactylosporangium siamense]
MPTRPPFCRSQAEAEAYIELHPCECGETGFQWSYAEGPGEDGYQGIHSGPCFGCGRARTFRFLVPEQALVLPGFSWSDGTRPSELLDAGEWMAVADALVAEASEDEDPRLRAHHFAGAAAAIDEVLLLGPADATHVPTDAIRSELGREIVAREPDRFRRLRLIARRRGYREESGEHVAEPVGPPLRARSLAEETAFMQASPCVCGALLFTPDGYQMRFHEERVTVVHQAPCDQCGRGRAFWFEEPRHAGRFEPAGHGYAPPDSGPSQLLDPGQWLLLAQAHGALAGGSDPAPPPGGDPAAGYWARLGVLASAVAAIDEVLKFIPPHSARVPVGAFWSPVGLSQYLDDPSRFEREWLLTELDRHARGLAEFLASHPDPPEEPGYENDENEDGA